MHSEQAFIRSEIRELEELLGEIPEENAIDRLSLTSRLTSAKKRLDTLPETSKLPTGQLTFQGAPVQGSRTIYGDFFGKAIELFANAYQTVSSALSRPLAATGPVPNSHHHRIKIRSIARGSFGFTFEATTNELPLLPNDHTPQLNALEQLESLFRNAAAGTDDDITKLVDEIDPRAVKAVHKFLGMLGKHEAWCEIRFGNHKFGYENLDQLKRAADRLKDDNIQKSIQTYRGVFQGALPTSRTFEFKLDDDGEIIKGTIDAAIENPEILNDEWLRKPAQLQLQVLRVGDGRPRYRLKTLHDVQPR